MREKGQTEVAKTLETPVFSRGIEILTEKFVFFFRSPHFILTLMAQNLWTTGFFHASPLPYRLVKIFLLYSHWCF